jgi:hypothetical protein
VKGNNMTENKNLENLPVPGEEQWELEERMKIHHSYRDFLPKNVVVMREIMPRYIANI